MSFLCSISYNGFILLRAKAQGPPAACKAPCPVSVTPDLAFSILLLTHVILAVLATRYSEHTSLYNATICTCLQHLMPSACPSFLLPKALATCSA